LEFKLGEGSLLGVRSIGVHRIEEQSLEHKYVRALLRGRLKGGSRDQGARGLDVGHEVGCSDSRGAPSNRKEHDPHFIFRD
jgi:hypothetical protein